MRGLYSLSAILFLKTIYRSGDLLILLSLGRIEGRNSSAFNFIILCLVEKKGREKEQSCQGRGPFLQGDFPFFSFCDAMARNYMMHKQLNDLEML